MIKYTSAFCLTPLPKNKYEEFQVKYPGFVALECYENVSYELGDNIKLYVNSTNGYIWYANVNRSSPTNLITFTNTKEIKQLIKQVIQKNFNYLGELDIIFSVYDISEMACTKTGNYYSAKKNEKKIMYGVIEKDMINDLLKGPEFYNKWSIYNIEENEKLSKIVPNDPPKDMKPWQELLKVVEKDSKSNKWFKPGDMILYFLPYYYAKKYLKDSYTFYDWNNKHCIPYTREGVITKMKERLDFLEDKYEEGRGLSIEKALVQIKTLCWLLGDDQYHNNMTIEKLMQYIKKNYIES